MTTRKKAPKTTLKKVKKTRQKQAKQAKYRHDKKKKTILVPERQISVKSRDSLPTVNPLRF